MGVVCGLFCGLFGFVVYVWFVCVVVFVLGFGLLSGFVVFGLYLDFLCV